MFEGKEKESRLTVAVCWVSIHHGMFFLCFGCFECTILITLRQATNHFIASHVCAIFSCCPFKKKVD